MLLGALGVNLLGNLLTGKKQLKQIKVQLEQVKEQLEQARISKLPYPLLILKYKSVIKTNLNLMLFI